jgi:hypothetical protein
MMLFRVEPTRAIHDHQLVVPLNLAILSEHPHHTTPAD